MITHFEIPENSKELYFKLSSSFQICSIECASPTYKFAGLYAIYKKDVCYYVGQSQNLASRISQHLTGKYEGCDRVEIYFARTNGFDDFHDRSKESRKSILEYSENALMLKLKPLENLLTPDSKNIDENLCFTSIYGDSFSDCQIYSSGYEISVGDIESICSISGPLFKKHNRFVIDYNARFGDEDSRKEGLI